MQSTSLSSHLPSLPLYAAARALRSALSPSSLVLRLRLRGAAGLNQGQEGTRTRHPRSHTPLCTALRARALSRMVKHFTLVVRPGRCRFALRLSLSVHVDSFCSRGAKRTLCTHATAQARLSDALPLAEGLETERNEAVEPHKGVAKHLCRKLAATAGPGGGGAAAAAQQQRRMSVESGPFCFQLRAPQCFLLNAVCAVLVLTPAL